MATLRRRHRNITVQIDTLRHFRRGVWLCLAGLAALLIQAAAVGDTPPPAAPVSGPIFVSPRRVVMISLDGMRPDAIDKAPAPFLQALIAAGSYTDKCENEYPPVTLPNHSSMITGLSVLQHGVILNVDLPGHIGSPTIFDMATAAGKRVVFFASKSKFTYLCKPESSAICMIDFDIDALTDKIVAALADVPPDLVFIHYGQPDGAGHQFNWMSPEYLVQVRHVDDLVRRVYNALVDRSLADSTVMLITADHGGQGNNHFLNTPLERYVPLIVHGPGIATGHRLKGPNYVRDVAPMTVALMGLDRSAAWEARFPADVIADSPSDSTPRPVDNSLPPTLPVSWPCGVVPLSLTGAATVAIWLAARRRHSGRRG